jgi:hypothetical protein
VGAPADLSKAEVDLFARSLAKRGVNLVRIHGPVYLSSGADFGKIDTNHVAKLHYLIAALKREGIYVCLSIYFPLWVKLDGARQRRLPRLHRQEPLRAPLLRREVPGRLSHVVGLRDEHREPPHGPRPEGWPGGGRDGRAW